MATEPTADQLAATAVGYAQARQWSAAKETAEAALALQSDHLDALHVLALVAGENGSLAEAVDLMQRIVGRVPGHQEARRNLGVLLGKMGRHQEAAACFRQLVALDPRIATSHFLLATALRDSGNIDAAINVLRRTLSIDPRHVPALICLGTALEKQGRLAEAVDILGQAVAHGASTAAYLLLGKLVQRQGRRFAARFCFREAIKVDSSPWKRETFAGLKPTHSVRALLDAKPWAVAGIALMALAGLLAAVGVSFGPRPATALAGAVVVAAGIIEVALRCCLPRPHGNYVWPPFTNVIFYPSDQGTPGVVGPGRFLTNSLGVRSSEPLPDRQRTIYVIGGSTVADYYLDQTEAWTQLLEDRLNATADRPRTWVGSLGRPANMSLHNVLLMNHGLAALPRGDLLINLIGANDLQYAIGSSYPRGMTPKDHLDWALSDRPAAQWFGYSGVRRLIRWRNERVRRLDGFPTKFHSDGGFLQWRHTRQAAPPEKIANALPPLDAALVMFRANIESMIEFARGYGAPLLFLTQPTLWQAHMRPEESRLLFCGGIGPLDEWVATQRYYSARALAHGMAMFNDTLMEVCHRTGTPCFDLAAAVPKVAKYFYDDMHLSEAGARLIAELVAAEVASLGLDDATRRTAGSALRSAGGARATG